ncbi:MAG: exodeoxyribonuclease VII small subunit, partial [Gemmatimonadetes bacterium]|nr:exodeoxyribonuclease VII small subunit [Gemmatimonadota bacterium]
MTGSSHSLEQRIARIEAIVQRLESDRLELEEALALFEEGTLEFTGRKGDRSLATQSFTITSTSTVQELMDFVNESLGIQTTAN